MFIETRELPVTAPARGPSPLKPSGKYHGLAEAIRWGCRKTKPLRGSYVDRASAYAEYACALGAAALGAGYSNGNVSDYLAVVFGNIWDDKIDGQYLHDKVAAMNDRGVSREAIADYLDSL